MCAYSFSKPAFSQKHIFYVDTLTTLVDAFAAPFNAVQPGDTISFNSGWRPYILIRNFSGASDKPVIFINGNGQVIIDTDHYYGISIQNCRFVRLTGSGDPKNFYGFLIRRVANGTGVGIGNMSSDFEIDHVSVSNVLIAGIYAKTDPDCSLASTRDKFTQFNTVIHDNYIENAGNEGLYIGNTKYFGQTINCDGKDTLLMPSLLSGVRVYSNIIKYSGWDGIQVSSASTDCQVYDNLVLYDSQAEVYGQMSGIIIGGGSKCDCYNNFISEGKGDGIEIHGLAGFRVFNNIIIDAGRNFEPLDTSQMKYGIYVTDISAQQDSSFSILFNTILNPKSDGIRFTSIKTRNNLIASNAIINPGTFDFYQNGNTSFKGNDAYIMLTDTQADVLQKNNFMARNSDSAGFADNGYSLQPGSVLINAAWSDTKNIRFDYFHNTRPYGSGADAGAVEYNPETAGTTSEVISKPLLFPNPVKTWLNIEYEVGQQITVFAGIYTLNGSLVMERKQDALPGKTQSLRFNVANLLPGVYLYSLHAGSHVISGKFIKNN
jgi:hypothetical protein